MRRALALTALLICALVAPAAADARLLVGIGDQQAASYNDPNLRKLKRLDTARLVVSWDWYKDKYTVGHIDLWMRATEHAGLRPLVTFNRNWSRSGRKRPPKLKTYVKSFKRFRARYPRVRDYSPWNEPNAKEQPFYRKPALAARYYNAMRNACRRCTVLAGDVKDGSNMLPWLAKYKRVARREKVWALHNYKDATRKRPFTKAFLRAVPGPVWLTETGGMRNRGGLKGQAKAVKRVFSLARKSRRIKRIYFYQWRPVPGSHWDSAFVSVSGKRRPAYFALRSGLRRR